MDIINVNYNNAIDDVNYYKSTGIFENNVDNNNVKLIFNDQNKPEGELYYNNIPLKYYKLDTSKLEESNNIDFMEMETSEEDTSEDNSKIIEEYNNLLIENKQLNDTINSLVSKYENNDDDSMMEAMKYQIIDLRIQLGQGKTVEDFSDEFPYLSKGS